MARRRSKKTDNDAEADFDPAASRTQWLKGVLELCLLSIVSQGEVYGYEICQKLETAGLGTIKGGTVYPRLASMEASGLVEIEWRVGESGPGRKYYTATPKGRAVLQKSSVEYGRFAATVQQLLQLESDSDIGQ